MKILLTCDPVIPVPPRLYGGYERIVAGLVEKLRELGHEIGLVAHPDSTAGADYFRAFPMANPASSYEHVRNALALRACAGEFQPDIVHSFSRLAYLLPIMRSRVPQIMSYGRFTGGRTIRIGSALGGPSLVFTGCSEFIAAMGRSGGGKWFAIPNFVDTNFYECGEAVPGDAPLVFLSRIEPIKGAHIAIEIAKRTGRRLIVAGNHDGGAYWKNEIEPNLGTGGIEYIGPVDDEQKRILLKKAAALVVPIQWDEPFGLVFAEALACGTPVITCPRGAAPEIIRNGIDGFLVRTVPEACEAVRNIGSIDRRECRRRAVTEFSTDVVAARYVDLYRAVVARSA